MQRGVVIRKRDIKIRDLSLFQRGVRSEVLGGVEDSWGEVREWRLVGMNPLQERAQT